MLLAFKSINIKYIILLILITFLILFISISINIYNKNKLDKLNKEYNAYKEISNIIQKESNKAIASLESAIKDKDKQISTALKSIENLKKEDIKKEIKIEALEKEREGLTDPTAIISNLENQVAGWKERFTLARQEIEEKDKIIFNLTETYNIQLNISAEYKKQLMTVVNERGALEKVNKILMRTNRSEKAQKYVAIGAVIVAIIFIVRGG